MVTVAVDPVLLMYAFRYALGRMTYSVGDVAGHLIEHKDAIKLDWKQQIVRDIEEAITEDRAGMSFDAEKWIDVVEAFGFKETARILTETLQARHEATLRAGLA